ncbi:MAG: hypothetical protein ABIN89_25760 [Chitinophagaceae bacterium]
MMKSTFMRLLVLIYGVSALTNSFAQGKKITGRITDDKKAPLFKTRIE